MTLVSVLARRFELRVGVVRPDVCGLHAFLTVLAVGHRIPGQTLHEKHRPQPPPWVLDEPVLRLQLTNQVEDMGVGLVAELGILRERGEIAIRLFSSVMRDSRYRICGAIRAGPYDIWPSKLSDDVDSGQGGNVLVQVDVIELLVPLNAEHLMPTGFKGFSDGTSASEQLQYLH